MKADDLSAQVWNAISDLVERNKSPREIFFVTVTKRDLKKKIVFADEFGNVGIPLIAFRYGFSYYDTVPTGNATDGAPVNTVKQKRNDPSHANPALLTEIVVPNVGEQIVVLDLWGAKQFPICIGVINSMSGYWEGQ